MFLTNMMLPKELKGYLCIPFIEKVTQKPHFLKRLLFKANQ